MHSSFAIQITWNALWISLCDVTFVGTENGFLIRCATQKALLLPTDIEFFLSCLHETTKYSRFHDISRRKLILTRITMWFPAINLVNTAVYRCKENCWGILVVFCTNLQRIWWVAGDFILWLEAMAPRASNTGNCIRLLSYFLPIWGNASISLYSSNKKLRWFSFGNWFFLSSRTHYSKTKIRPNGGGK